MENDFSSSININSWVTLKKLENATREEFERYAQFILLLIGENYIKTRMNKDDGIDGYTLLRNELPRKGLDNDGNVKKVYKFFSIYGPEAKTSWTEKKAKIFKDLNNVLSYSTETQSIVDKWFLVTNFDLKHSYEVEIAAMCEDAGIEYELYYPQKMISLLDTPEQIYKALAFVDQLPAPKRKLTDFHYHIFAQESLKLLVEYQDRTTTEQLELVNYIINSMLLYIPAEEYIKGYSKKRMSFLGLSKTIKKYTTLHSNEHFLFHQYSKKQKRFFTHTFKDAKDLGLFKESHIYKDENNEFVLFVKDLYSLYWISIYIRSYITFRGTYSLIEILSRFHRHEQWKKKNESENKLA